MTELKYARSYFRMCAESLKKFEDPKDSTDDYKCGIKFGNVLIDEIDRLSAELNKFRTEPCKDCK